MCLTKQSYFEKSLKHEGICGKHLFLGVKWRCCMFTEKSCVQKNIFKIFMNVGTCWNFSNFIPHSLLRSQYDVVVVYLLTFALPTHVFLRDFKRGFDYILKWIRAVTHISLEYFLQFFFESFYVKCNPFRSIPVYLIIVLFISTQIMKSQ